MVNAYVNAMGLFFFEKIISLKKSGPHLLGLPKKNAEFASHWRLEADGGNIYTPEVFHMEPELSTNGKFGDSELGKKTFSFGAMGKNWGCIIRIYP